MLLLWGSITDASIKDKLTKHKTIINYSGLPKYCVIAVINSFIMNLYKVLFTHTAPKDSKEGIMTYLLAENEEQVYSFIDKEYNYECWKDNEEDEDREPINIYDEDYNITGTKAFKEHIIDLKGEMNDEDYDYSDAYYGITLYGWELVKENVTSDYSEMIALNVFKNCL